MLADVSYSAWATEQDPSAELSSLKPDGEYLRISPAQIIIHSVDHSTLDRGQIISMPRTLGVRPPDTDQLSFYMTLQQTGVRHNPTLLCAAKAASRKFAAERTMIEHVCTMLIEPSACPICLRRYFAVP